MTEMTKLPKELPYLFSFDGIFGGIKIFESAALVITKLKRFPRTKKRRIIKKWMKRPCNVITFPDPSLYVINTTDTFLGGGDRVVIGHPETVAKVKAKLNERCPTSWGEEKLVGRGEISFPSRGV